MELKKKKLLPRLRELLEAKINMLLSRMIGCNIKIDIDKYLYIHTINDEIE